MGGVSGPQEMLTKCLTHAVQEIKVRRNQYNQCSQCNQDGVKMDSNQDLPYCQQEDGVNNQTFWVKMASNLEAGKASNQ